ncbi:AbrB family transcriptional regulator [Paracoccus aurantiacus]|uniref:AbrB family transcriptional regulator n=1 Tax=Paracoccus aurantiacus TaxID=2599412 RepID=UPI00164B3D7D|nr:AbrB family transcriptional regulator [Paracoccus aurantiacus]
MTRLFRPRHGFLRLALIYLAGAVIGWLGTLAGLPLPYMIGPLLMTAALSLSQRLTAPLPVRTRPFGQAVVASTVGLAFTPAALRAVIEAMPLLIVMSAMTASLALAVSVLQARLSGARLSRMVLATFPVAPVESAVIAESVGIPPAPVVMAQTLRIAAIVVSVPLLIYAIDGRPQIAALPASAGWNPAGLIVLIAVAAGGGFLFRLLGWANPFFLGPLAAAGAVTAAGFELPHYPAVMLAAAQILLGAWLGSTFQPHLFRGARREMVVSLGGTLLMLTLTCAGAVMLSRLTGIGWEVLVLGVAPGGVTEMALTAQYLHLDPSLVTAAHVVRIFMLMPLARPLIRLVGRIEARSG